LLFGNQLGKHDIKELVDTIYEELIKGNIAYERIVQSNQRIKALRKN
jgi:beta-N-acetylhexosaminidase